MKQYSAAALAKLKAIQDKYANEPLTPVPKTRITGVWVSTAPQKTTTDVFGNPIGKPVSARVQRIRDLQAGKRVTPVKRVQHDWFGDNDPQVTRRPVQQGIARSAQTKMRPEESYEDWTKRMEAAMDEAADYMENK